VRGDVRQPWADGPRTQQCDGLAFSQGASRGAAGSGKPLIRRVRNAGRKAVSVEVLGWPAHVAKDMDRSAMGAAAPDVPHALSRGDGEEE